jgi:hypothetical protein
MTDMLIEKGRVQRLGHTTVFKEMVITSIFPMASCFVSDANCTAQIPGMLN